MKRPITGFGIDDVGDPVAILSCGHPQHVRNIPPFINRPWVESEAGRNSMLGEVLNCVRCDQFELPENFVAYKKTPVFTEATLPEGLKKNHTTKMGVWAKIIVTEGVLHYCVDALKVEINLSPGMPGIVIPEMSHHVAAQGQVQFYVEFYRKPGSE